MPLRSKDRSGPSDVIWLWSMAAAFACVLIYPGGVSYDLKVGLATVLILDSIGAAIVLYVYTKFDFSNNVFDALLAIFFFVILLVAFFNFLGHDLYAAIAVIAVIRCAYDVYVYMRTPLGESGVHARRYFNIFLQAAIPLGYVTVFALIAPQMGYSVRRDERFFECETDVCKLLSPPDAYILFGLFLYPLLGWLNLKWQPQWMRWIPCPKRFED